MTTKTRTQQIVDEAIANVAREYGLHASTVTTALFEDPNGIVARDVADRVAAGLEGSDRSYGFVGTDADGFAHYLGPAL